MNTVTAYAATVKPLSPSRLVNGFTCDPMNPAAVTEVELPNGRVGFQVGPMGAIYASKAVALVHAEERRAETVEAAPVVYPAEAWANEILTTLANVSTEDQKSHAYYLLCDDWLSGKTTEGVGPSLESLREDVELAALAASYDPTDYPDHYSPLECGEMDELRMLAPVAIEESFARPVRRRRRVNAAKQKRALAMA